MGRPARSGAFPGASDVQSNKASANYYDMLQPNVTCRQCWTQCRRRAALSRGSFHGQPPRHATMHAVQALPTSCELQYDVRQASTAAELRAAAYLRAYSFYKYPEDRSPMAARAHRRMKGDSEWESVTAKVAGTETNYKAMKVTCFVATIRDNPECKVAQQVSQDMDLSTKLPADPAGGAGRNTPQLVIGSLDLNIGAVLPAEELVGRQPQQDAATKRAYLANVCVAGAARRMGVAHALMERAEEEAVRAGVEHLYVHVVHDNQPAVQLYKDALGFELEAEESAGFAKALQRPRRLLLGKRIGQ